MTEKGPFFRPKTYRRNVVRWAGFSAVDLSMNGKGLPDERQLQDLDDALLGAGRTLGELEADFKALNDPAQSRTPISWDEFMERYYEQ